MPIKKDSCRHSERQRMKQMAAEGYHPAQIANAVSVKQYLVERVIDGTWDAQEAAQQEEQKAMNAKREKAALEEKGRDAAMVAAAVVAATKGTNNVEEESTFEEASTDAEPDEEA